MTGVYGGWVGLRRIGFIDPLKTCVLNRRHHHLWGGKCLWVWMISGAAWHHTHENAALSIGKYSVMEDRRV